MPSALATPIEALPGGLPFAFVGSEHQLRADVEGFWDAAADVSGLGPVLDGGETPVTVRSVLRLAPERAVRLKWLCVSVQRELPSGFTALTLLYRARRRRLLVFELPDDPLLPSLPALAAEVGEVLQYVPRHRFTFRRDWSESSLRQIGKAPRAVDLEPGWQRLRAVWQAARRAETSFLVAEPLAVDRERGVFYQSELPGADLAGLIDGTNAAGLLRRAGRVHAELQSLDVPGIPEWRTVQMLPQVREQGELVALFRPDAAPLVDSIAELLLATVPAPAAASFCHGDLCCSHLLEHEGTWSVIDADGCRNGDPGQDVARLLAFLKQDVPYLRERFAAPDGGHDELDAAIDSFLEGYAEAARVPLDPARLSWYQLAHELHYLARMFKRDLYDAVAFERGTERLATLSEQLRHQLAGRRRP